MKKTYLWVGIVIILIIIGAVLYTQKGSIAGAPSASADFGTYQYECDEHVNFTMTPSADMSTIKVEAAGGGTYPPTSTLTRQQAASGVRYTGNGVVMTARGETITLGEGDSAINCSPVSDPNNAPFNFGD